MSHELIYQYIWSDKTEGGALRLSLVISYLPQYFPILCSKWCTPPKVDST